MVYDEEGENAQTGRRAERNMATAALCGGPDTKSMVGLRQFERYL